MSKVALITGITGQDGYYLTKLLLEKKDYVQIELKKIVLRLNVQEIKYML